ncbi:DNA (cytosine-5)-methyltransferase 1 [Microdochium nivale]|nr:DNA (cytosine-5)-methyltransferase 1 [Microdochium nivale]
MCIDRCFVAEPRLTQPASLNTNNSNDGQDDDFVVTNELQARVEQRLRSRRNTTRPSAIPVISLDDSDDDDDDDDDDADQVGPGTSTHPQISTIDLTGSSAPIHHQDTQQLPVPLQIRDIAHIQQRHGDRLLSKYRIGNGETVSAGNVVELNCKLSSFNVNYLLVQHILRTDCGHVLVAGIPLGRSRVMKSWLPPTAYEACLIFEANDNVRHLSIEQQSLVEVAAANILRRQRVVFTNSKSDQQRSHAARVNALICRWICTLIYADAAKRAACKPRENILQQIHETQASRGFATSERERRDSWRGVQSVRGGAHLPPKTKNGIEVVMLDGDDDDEREPDSSAGVATEWIQAQQGQQYTFRDMFCGASGTSCGVKAAGFRVQIGCDADATACTTYRLNYPDTRLVEGNVADIISSTELYHVDVLHLSPPC